MSHFHWWGIQHGDGLRRGEVARRHADTGMYLLESEALGGNHSTPRC